MFTGAVELWLEQEGEAQLCPKRRGLHTQVQPGKTHTGCNPPRTEEPSIRAFSIQGQKKYCFPLHYFPPKHKIII